MIEAIRPFIPIIQKELNVKSVIFDHDESRYIALSAKINAAKIGRKLGKQTPVLNQKIQALNFAQINQFEQQGSITLRACFPRR